MRAIQNGTKTATRRLIKPKYSNTNIEIIKNKYGRQLVEIQDENDVKDVILPDGKHCCQLRAMRENTPKYRVGDILYVRETWCKKQSSYDQCVDTSSFTSSPVCFMSMVKTEYFYRAVCEDEEADTGWCPSIHMPKEAARIFLRVTGVRVERLQDITITGLQEEGILNDGYISQYAAMTTTAFEDFKDLWDSAIKKSDLEKYGWDANPWVWVIEFERLEVTE